MPDGTVQLAADSTGKKVDTSELTVGANTVERQRIVIADDSVAAALAKIINSAPAGTEYALVVRPIDPAEAAQGAALPPEAMIMSGQDAANLVRVLRTDAHGANGGDLKTHIWSDSGSVNLGELAANPFHVKVSDGTNVLTLEQSITDAEAGTDWGVPAECYVMMYNGTTWDRLRGTIANGILADVSRIVAALPAGTNIMGKVGIDQTTPGTTNGVQVNAALPVGANVIGKVSIDQTTPGTTNLVSAAQGTPAAVANAWTAKITDGTNTAAVKAASTYPAFTDAALVVAGREVGNTGATAPVSAALKGHIFNTTPAAVTSGQMAFAQCTARGEQLVALANGNIQVAVKAASTAAAATDPALVVSMAGANSATKIGDGTNNAAIKAASTAAVAADPTIAVAISPNLPAPTQSFVNSAATTNATSVKASAGTVYNITASNTGGAAAFVKFYNKASAPTVGTDVPVFTMAIPASGTVTIAPALVGIRFATGIALAITNLAADSDTTAVAAAQVKVATSYI